MKATLLSYLSGMSGDFLAFMIHQDPRFHTISDELIIEDVKVSKHNRWFFPNLLEPIGLEAKIYPNNRAWAVDKKSIKTLKKIYGNKEIILPSHWYNNINLKSTNNLFNQGIRLFVREKPILKICYALWWIKSHVVANYIWPHRQEEINEMIMSNHKHKKLLLGILDCYHNWKYLSIKHDILNEGKLDLYTYVSRHFNEVYRKNNNTKYKLNYLLIDVDNLIYTSTSNIGIIENYFQIKIDRSLIETYKKSNFDTIEKYLGIKIDSPEFENDKIYFDSIFEYAQNVINIGPNQFDYHKGIL
jgi:hypothetical protein